MNAKHLALVRDLRQLGGTVCMDAAALIDSQEREITELRDGAAHDELTISTLRKQLATADARLEPL